MTSTRTQQFLAALLLGLAVIGGIGIVQAAWHWLAPLIGTSGLFHALGVAISSIASEWFVAIGTLLLVYVTYRLYVATQLLARATTYTLESEGPFLTIIAWSDDNAESVAIMQDPLKNISLTPHDFGWAEEDRRNLDCKQILDARAAGSPAAYINVLVINKASKPLGVAVNVEVKMTFGFGAGNDLPPHPRVIERTLHVPIQEPQLSSAFQVFEVTGLSGYLFIPEGVTYSDINGRRRQAATAYGILRKVLLQFDSRGKVFAPRKGEFTDAV